MANAGLRQQIEPHVIQGREGRHMGMVFPASSGEKCPRDDCGSQRVERLGRQADFGNLSLDSSVRTLWLCLKCQRPFKLVRRVGAQVGVTTERRRWAPVVQLDTESVADTAAHVTGRRVS